MQNTSSDSSFFVQTSSPLSSEELHSRTPDLQTFLNSTVEEGGLVRAGTVMTLLGYTQHGVEFVAYENEGRVVAQAGTTPGFIKKIFAVYLGDVEHESLFEDLKSRLLNFDFAWK